METARKLTIADDPKRISNNKPRPLWREPMAEEKIMETVEKLMTENITYGKDRILGFPGTTPEPVSVDVYSRFIARHSNNIGLHSNKKIGIASEVGFSGSQEAERQVIEMAADLMGAYPEEIDGYIASGGTEANIVGCWIGRNLENNRPTAMVCSFLTHYSILKACNVLRIGTKANDDGSGIHILGTDNSGHILLHQLEEKLYEIVAKGIQNIIVIGNAGTTMLGSVDDIPAMGKIIRGIKIDFPDLNIHFHVDAAFGGFVIPFIENLPNIGFEISEVDSITLDVHKMGLAPYGSGIILARRGLFEKIKTSAPYVPGNDLTLCGSRSGTMALSCWAAMRKIGKNGYAQKAFRLMKLTHYIQSRFYDFRIPTFRSDINIVAVKIPLSEAMKAKYITHTHNDFPVNMSNPTNTGQKIVWNVVVMEHTRKKLIEEFLSDFQKDHFEKGYFY